MRNKVEYWTGTTFDTKHLIPWTIVKAWKKDGRLKMMLNFRVNFSKIELICAYCTNSEP